MDSRDDMQQLSSRLAYRRRDATRTHDRIEDNSEEGLHGGSRTAGLTSHGLTAKARAERDLESSLPAVERTNALIHDWTVDAAAAIARSSLPSEHDAELSVRPTQRLRKRLGLRAAKEAEDLQLIWGPIAKAGVLALLDVVVDDQQSELDEEKLVEQCDEGLDVEAFSRATGLPEEAHSSVLRHCADALIAKRLDNVELGYRGRQTTITVDPEAHILKVRSHNPSEHL